MGGEARTSRTLTPVLCLLYPLRRMVQWNKYHKTGLPGTLPFAASSEPKAYLVMSSLPPESEQLFVLPRHKVDSGVLEQGWEHEEQAHGHPNVNGFHIGHLGRRWGKSTGKWGESREKSWVPRNVFCSLGPPPPSLTHCCPLSAGILGWRVQRETEEKCIKKTGQNIGEEKEHGA